MHVNDPHRCNGARLVQAAHVTDDVTGNLHTLSEGTIPKQAWPLYGRSFLSSRDGAEAYA